MTRRYSHAGGAPGPLKHLENQPKSSRSASPSPSRSPLAHRPPMQITPSQVEPIADRAGLRRVPWSLSQFAAHDNAPASAGACRVVELRLSVHLSHARRFNVGRCAPSPCVRYGQLPSLKQHTPTGSICHLGEHGPHCVIIQENCGRAGVGPQAWISLRGKGQLCLAGCRTAPPNTSTT